MNAPRNADRGKDKVGSRFDWQLAKNPDYCPYCMRCKGLQRMVRVEPYFWRCPVCPAIHDDRPNMRDAE